MPSIVAQGLQADFRKFFTTSATVLSIFLANSLCDTDREGVENRKKCKKYINNKLNHILNYLLRFLTLRNFFLPPDAKTKHRVFLKIIFTVEKVSC